MFSRFAAALAVASLAIGALAQVTINTPTSVVVCQPVQISWTGGTAPYFLSILPGNQPSAAALVSFASSTATSLTWTANLAAGTSIFFQVRDNAGALGQSGTVTIQTSSDTSCVGQSSSAVSSATGSTSGSVTVSTSAASTTSRATTSTTSTTTHTTSAALTSTTSHTTSASTSAPASSTTSTSGATKMASGALALVGAAVLAAVL